MALLTLLLLSLAVQITSSVFYDPAFESVRKYVGFGSDLNPNYLFYVPLTALVWRRLGFVPLVFIVGSQRAGSTLDHVAIVQNYATNWAGARVIEVQRAADISFQFAMVGRLFLSCERYLDPLSELMLTDVDMWVFDHQFSKNRNKSRAAHYFGFMMEDPSEDYLTRYGPQMCHMSMSVGSWRAMMGLPEGGCDFEETVRDVIWSEYESPGGYVWEFDQVLLRNKLVAWGKQIDFNRQNTSTVMDGRFRSWDRNKYPAGYNFSTYGAAHVPRPGFDPERWEVTRELLHWLLPDEMSTIDLYYREFTSALKFLNL